MQTPTSYPLAPACAFSRGPGSHSPSRALSSRPQPRRRTTAFGPQSALMTVGGPRIRIPTGQPDLLADVPGFQSLKTRTRRILSREGVLLTGQFMALSASVLRRFEGLGEQSRQELLAWAETQGLVLSENT